MGLPIYITPVTIVPIKLDINAITARRRRRPLRRLSASRLREVSLAQSACPGVGLFRSPLLTRMDPCGALPISF